ncbi:MAG TPA: MlaD family protein [Treponemataceae bacterium]|nr:MlaD family protein [Treponemataceae bacterium]
MNVGGYLKIGLFFIVLGIGGFAYITMSSDGFNSLNTQVYDVILDDATGLSTNSKVYMAGVPVGKIQSIELDRNLAILRIAFLKDIDIRQNAMLSRKSSSILGTSILDLSPGTEISPILPAGSRIDSRPGSGDMAALMGSVQSLGTDISSMLREFQETQLKLLSVSLETFNSIALKLDQRSDAELARISRILESTAVITERLERIVAGSEADIEASVREIRLAAENIRSVTEELKTGGTLDRIDGAIDEVTLLAQNASALAQNADRVVADAGHIVAKASGLGVEVDARSDYQILSGSVGTSAGIRLEPRSKDRWYRVGVGQAPGVEDGTGSGTWEVAVDAEIARTFGLMTLRGGLYSSRAGLGLDLDPADWVSFSGEVFDFRTGEAPNLRGTVTLYPFFNPVSDKPWNWVYVRGGVSSALRSDRDFFVGAGIRFADEEIRGLVGLIPLAGN